MQFEIAIRASQGARRAQEDCAFGWPYADFEANTSSAPLPPLPRAQAGRVAAVLCDGMGGHIGGAMASRTACSNFLPALLDGDGPVRERLMHALEQANFAITDQINRNPTYSGMGSTLIGIDATADGLAWVSVGDSLLYVWRDGEIALINEDHSLAPEIDKLAAAGKISWSAARSDPRRHFLRSALTGSEIELIDISYKAAPLALGDVILLASDGINTLESDVIAERIRQTAGQSAAMIAQGLLDDVESAGEPHQDNTTIVAIRVLSSESPADV